MAEPESGSTTEVSESDEDGEAGEDRNEESTPAAVPAPPASLHLSASIQQMQPQDAGSTSKSEMSTLCLLNDLNKPFRPV